MLTNHRDWAQKYRPTSLDDLIVPSVLRERLSRIVAQGGGMSLLFYGSPGCGKTTAASLINPNSTYVMNCTTNNSIDMVRGLVRTCSSMTLHGDRRLVLLDEADGLSKDAQAALRGAVESLSIANDFVMTANDPSRLSDAIKSRFLPVAFEAARDPAFLALIESRLARILRDEGHEAPSVGYLKALVRREFPDIRRMLKCMQFEVGERTSRS